MSRYGIETIAESVYQSSVCPFMRERCCANGNEDCQKCVKEWFADHDKQIRNEVIEEVIELIDAYPNDLDRRTEETHLIFATLGDIIMHIRQMKEND